MCQLCDHGLKTPTDHMIEEAWQAGAEANKPSYNWDQAGDNLAAYGWSNAGTQPITFAFRSTDPANPAFERFDANLIAQTEKAFQLWSDVANISFQRVGAGTTGESAYSNDATILLSGDSGPSSYGWAYYPGSRNAGSLSGDVFLDTRNGQFDDVSEGSYEFLAVLHEIGHAIGISHPGSYNGGSPSYANDAQYAEDSRQFTVMSYFSAENTGASHGWNFGATPLLHDIAAAQKLYGANWNTRSDDTTYGFNSNSGRDSFSLNIAGDKAVFAIWDGGGNDTLDLSGYNQNQRIDINQEAFSDAGGLTKNIAIARDVIIENAIGGSGDDVIIGNSADNNLDGLAGNDEIYGNAGKDNIDGGLGRDTLFGGSSNDIITGGANDDTISGGKHKDYLWGDDGDDTINGNSGDDIIDGGQGDDIIVGGTGNDRIDGGADNDVLDGGSGNDRFIGSAGNDLITGGSGVDTIDYSSAAPGIVVDLHAHTASGSSIDQDQLHGIENVKATTGADVIKGDKRDNEFWGLDGDDWFRGLEGADVFKGGNGADTYKWWLKDVYQDGDHMGMDVIRDFSLNQDVLDFRAFDEEDVVGIELHETDDGTVVQFELTTEDVIDVVLLQDKFGLDVDTLIANENILV
ncbi:MAG: M10 family metallopeptidase C-terminal domain-containing protein [Pseudomonadota bacterium]